MIGPPVVVKVGGSLLDWPGLPARLANYLESRRDDRLILVVGGGRAADFVRELDRIHGLGEGHSHALALRSMDLTAHALAALVPGLVAVPDADSLPGAWGRHQTPILDPRPILEADDRLGRDPLPHSWSVTSDSIAARVAARLGASELVLLKSAPLPPGADRAWAARLGLVDPHFPAAARGLGRVEYLNLRDPGPVAGPTPRLLL